MKKILFVLSCFIIAFSAAMLTVGCGKVNPAAPTSIASPTPTRTADITADVVVGVLANVSIFTVATVTYQVGVYTTAGVTVTTASVTVNGPNGIKTLVYNGASGFYEYGSTSTADYQYGKKYTISVIDGLNTYAQDVIAASDITIAGDGSTVSWTDSSPGIAADMIMTTDPLSNPHTYGPGITSPYNLAGAGAFGYGPGIYSVSALIMSTQMPAFGGANPLSNVSVANARISAVIK